MPTIAISYRRSDSAAIAGRIFDRLTARYGEHAVFMDIDNIPFGIDFRKHIRETLERTDVLIALIGTDWLGRNAAGARMQEPADPVRVEIETAVERKTPIIPVLIDGAKMPDSATLPATFGDFAYLNAAEVSSGRNFRSEMGRLIANIDGIAAASAAPKLFSAYRLEAFTSISSAPKWRVDLLLYFSLPLVVVLVAHYLIVYELNLNTGYLRLSTGLVPLAAGFALFWIGRHGAGRAVGFALTLGLAGAVGMTILESLYSGDPILPQSRIEWLENFQFAATIALSFIVGYLAARAARAFLGRTFGKF